MSNQVLEVGHGGEHAEDLLAARLLDDRMLRLAEGHEEIYFDTSLAVDEHVHGLKVVGVFGHRRDAPEIGFVECLQSPQCILGANHNVEVARHSG
jgi:hypothetical protein